MIAAELLAAAADADMTILGKGGWSHPGRRLGSTAREVLVQTQRLTLFLEHGARLGLPVLVVYDGSPEARRALRAAAQLLRGRESQLTVLTLAEDEDAAQTMQAQIGKWLAEQDLQAHYRWLVECDIDDLVHVIHAEGCQVVVLPSLSENLAEDVVTVLLETLECPVLVVR
jgi:nucleotide-binding universal stress UspA family protein